MPEYSSTTITPSDGVQVPGMNGSTSGNFLLSALKSYILSEKGLANGLASLDGNGKLTASQLPDLADDVIVVASYASLPATGTAGKLYITADNNKMYRWDPDLTTPDYVELSVDLSAYATIADLQDGTLEPLISTKARKDQNGNVIDQTYATKAELAAEESARETEDSRLKSAIEGNSQRIENLEVAVSGSLVQTNTDATMANTKTITNANEILPWAILKRVGARAVAWNQLINLSLATIKAKNTTGTWSDNVYTLDNKTFTVDEANQTVTVNGTAGSSSVQFYLTDNNPFGITHKIWMRGAKNSVNLKFTNNIDSAVTDTGDGKILTSYANASCIVLLDISASSAPSNVVISPQVTDIDVAGLSSYTTSQLKALFPANYPYHATSIIPLNPSAFKVVGWNKLNLARTKVDANYTADTLMNWDETKCYKGSGSNDGQPNYAVSADVSNGKITVTPTYQGYGLSFPVKVQPNKEYYLKAKMTKGNKLYFNIGLYGADGAFVQRVYFAYDSASPYEGNYTFTTPANVYWANICFTGSANTETVYEEVNFNLSQPDTSKPLHNGVYEAYKETTIDTSFTSDYKYVNENCYDYSENVMVDGVMRREEHKGIVGEVDASQQTWSYTDGTFRLQWADAAVATDDVALAGYDVCSYLIAAGNIPNMCIKMRDVTSGRFYIRNDGYNLETIEQFKATLGKIYYRRATPSTPTLHDPIPNLPVEDGTTVQAVTPQTDLVNAIDVPSTIAYMTKIGG